MPGRHVVVDGSNIATEGRTLPSLAQLDESVREYLLENPADTVTVVVDASFAHRIDPSELPMFEEAEAANEVVSPPAGAIGRGDAFLLRIADKTGATVLSNDSFQEFHGEYDWLFNNGRLIGGKPVPGVGWIFTPRTPVRGPKSREAVKEAKRRNKTETVEGTGLDLAAARGREGGVRRGRQVAAAIATATEEAEEVDAGGRRRRRGRAGAPPAEPVNEPLAFITFIAAHPLGSEVTGTVDSFSSHGAFVDAEGTRCYVPLSAMADPAPRKGRDVLGKGEERTFVVQALDPLRRGVELALPGFARVAAMPTPETVEAEIGAVTGESPTGEPASARDPAPRSRRRSTRSAGDGEATTEAVAAQAAGDTGSTAGSGGAPAAGRRRTKAAAPVDESPATTPAMSSETPAAPAGRRRRTAAPPEADVAVADVAASTTAAGRSRRARTGTGAAPTSVETAPVETPPVETPAAEAAPARPRRRRPVEPVPVEPAPVEPVAAPARRARKAPAPPVAGDAVTTPAVGARRRNAAAAEPTTTAAAPAKAAPRKAAPRKAAAVKAGAPAKAAPARAAGKKAAGTKAAAPEPAAAKASKTTPAGKVAAAKAPTAKAGAKAAKAAPARPSAPAKATPAPKAATAVRATSAPKPAKAASAPKAARTVGASKAAKAAKTSEPAAATRATKAAGRAGGPAPGTDPDDAPPSIAGRRSPRRTAAASREGRGSTGRA